MQLIETKRNKIKKTTNMKANTTAAENSFCKVLIGIFFIFYTIFHLT